MKTGYKLLIGALAFVATNAFAAELLTKAEFEKVESQYTLIGNINTSNERPLRMRKKICSKKRMRKGLMWSC